MPAPSGRRNSANEWFAEGQSMLVLSPWFHTLTLLAFIRTFHRGSFILSGGTRPVTADLVSEMLNQTTPYVVALTPSLVEDLSDTEEGLKALAIPKAVYCGGAPLSTTAGDKVKDFTDLRQAIGSTEAALIHSLQPLAKEDWNYFEWSPEIGVEMLPEEDGKYELTIKKQEDNRHQGVFYSFPDIDRWHTNDLFEQHHEKPGLWHYVGRKDDVLVLSNGEKFNPVDFEKTVEGHPIVQGAIVVGQSRFQTALIMEPHWEMLSEGMKAEDLLDILWSHVEKANAAAVGHGKVWKSKVAFAKRDKPFRRAPKGSIMRRATVELYGPEIEALYSNEESDEKLGRLEKTADLPTVKDFVRRAIVLTMPIIEGDLPDDADMFSLGVDSLQVLALSSTLSHALPREDDASVPARLIYSNPSINSLAEMLRTKLTGDAGSKEGPSEISKEMKMADMVEKYTKGLPSWKHHEAENRTYKCVILTGSTGALGTYMLEGLLNDPHVERVYCLNRSSDAEARQKQRFENWGIHSSMAKARFLQTDFSKEHFGLPEPQYVELLRHANAFIHNAWPVDFNLTLESFEKTHIAGVRRVIDFSLASPFRPHILFISSIASVGAYRNSSSVPEIHFDDDSVPLPQGYGGSKHVASRVLATAAERCGLPVSIIRSGQLAGPAQENGMWNKQEWIPSIIATSKAMGKIPKTLGNGNTVDWVPIDSAARVVLDLVRVRSTVQTEAQTQGLFRTKSGRQVSQPLSTFHIANPKVTTFTDLVPAIQSFYSSDRLESVDFRAWIDELEGSSMTKEEIEKKPGLKLLDFYEGLAGEAGLPRMQTERTEEASETLRSLEAVNGELVKRWCAQWSF